MPQNKDNEDWRNMIGENFEIVHDRYLHTLGNLSLTGYNSELSDKSFTDKVKMIKDKAKNIKIYSREFNKEFEKLQKDHERVAQAANILEEIRVEYCSSHRR
jgi:hypothetical protein